jgi:hypothetical protein
LAGQGKTSISDMVLNDPYVYLSSNDKYASKSPGEAICCFEYGAIGYAGCHIQASNFIVTHEYLFSYCFMLNLPGNVSLDTTPLGFTRGLGNLPVDSVKMVHGMKNRACTAPKVDMSSTPMGTSYGSMEVNQQNS